MMMMIIMILILNTTTTTTTNNNGTEVEAKKVKQAIKQLLLSSKQRFLN